MDKQLRAAFVFTMQRVGNNELAAMNNAIQWLDILPRENLAFDTAVEMNLVDSEGRPYDTEALRDACAYEVNRRVDLVEFNGETK